MSSERHGNSTVWVGEHESMSEIQWNFVLMDRSQRFRLLLSGDFNEGRVIGSKFLRLRCQPWCSTVVRPYYILKIN